MSNNLQKLYNELRDIAKEIERTFTNETDEELMKTRKKRVIEAHNKVIQYIKDRYNQYTEEDRKETTKVAKDTKALVKYALKKLQCNYETSKNILDIINENNVPGPIYRRITRRNTIDTWPTDAESFLELQNITANKKTYDLNISGIGKLPKQQQNCKK